jgi:hypothetical protein
MSAILKRMRVRVLSRQITSRNPKASMSLLPSAAELSAGTTEGRSRSLEVEMKCALLLLLSAGIVLAGFGPPVRIDHQDLPNHSCHTCAIAVGPGAPSSQPIYVVFEDDSVAGISGVRADIMLQKSTNAGRTWLPNDLLIERGVPGAFDPDITTDSDGNVYIVYQGAYRDTAGAWDHRLLCVRSSDGGATWSAPARIDDDSIRMISRVRIAAGTAGNLLCAWNDWRTGCSHIWSSVSTDRGATWGQNVRVCDDTTNADCGHADVFVQPGTNHYLVAGDGYRWVGSYLRPCAFLYRSTDCGQTFQPGVQLDTWNRCAGGPHVVADRNHIICDYFGNGEAVRDTEVAEARTFYTQADSWGSPAPMTNLDSLHALYYGGALALSGDGRVHTALMVDDTALGYDIYYTSSSDHGVSWSDIEPVYIDSAQGNWYPDIGADSAGHAYTVWYSPSVQSGKVWFATNAPLGIAEEPTRPNIGAQPSATVVRRVLYLPRSLDPSISSRLLDIGGRQVMGLKPGANDVRALAPGVYFVREAQEQAQAQAVRKVVVTR